MCCFFTALVLLGPRAGLLVWWLFNASRFRLTFDRFIWPLLGFIFLPWTTLIYVAVWSPLQGVSGFGWIMVGIGVLVDVLSHTGGGWSNRDRIPGARDALDDLGPQVGPARELIGGANAVSEAFAPYRGDQNI